MIYLIYSGDIYPIYIYNIYISTIYPIYTGYIDDITNYVIPAEVEQETHIYVLTKPEMSVIES